MKKLDISKRSKKEQREYHAKQRVLVKFNTGTRSHQTDKHPSRARAKEMIRSER